MSETWRLVAARQMTFGETVEAFERTVHDRLVLIECKRRLALHYMRDTEIERDPGDEDCQIAARPASIKQDDGEADTVAAMETTTDTHVEVDTARRGE